VVPDGLGPMVDQRHAWAGNKEALAHVRGGISRPPRAGRSLQEVAPDLARHWHAQKNGDVTPADVAATSRQLASWRCPDCKIVGPDVMVKSKEAIHRKKGAGYGCRPCSLRRRDLPKPGMSLADRLPHLVAEFDFEANAPLTPDTIPAGSNEPVRWLCRVGSDHPSYPASPANRRRSGCPACAGKAVVGSNCHR
jgi:hypothetical protein